MLPSAIRAGYSYKSRFRSWYGTCKGLTGKTVLVGSSLAPLHQDRGRTRPCEASNYQERAERAAAA